MFNSSNELPICWYVPIGLQIICAEGTTELMRTQIGSHCRTASSRTFMRELWTHPKRLSVSLCEGDDVATAAGEVCCSEGDSLPLERSKDSNRSKRSKIARLAGSKLEDVRHRLQMQQDVHDGVQMKKSSCHPWIHKMNGTSLFVYNIAL